MTQQIKGQAKIAVNLKDGYYVCALGHQGKPWSKGADEGKVSPVFLTREEAIKWAEKHGWQVLSL